MEKAEILEMTLAYVSQLHGARCRLPSGDVISGGPSRKLHTKARDDLQEVEPSSSSSEYRAGFSECFIHVQRFLADHAAATSAEKMSNAALRLPQLLSSHLSQFVGDARRSRDNDRVVRSLPPSPDTTLSARPSSDPSLPVLPSTSPAIKLRQSFSRSSSLTAEQISSSLGHHALPLFLPASPSNADHDVWRPWRPDTTNCFQRSDVSDASSAL